MQVICRTSVLQYFVYNHHFVLQKGFNALMVAARAGHLNVVRILVQEKADLEAVNDLGFTALLLAAQRGELCVVQYLVENNANIEHFNKKGFTALHWACNTGNDAVAAFLLHRGASARVANNGGYTPIHACAGREEYSKCLKVILKHDPRLLVSCMKVLFRILACVFKEIPSATSNCVFTLIQCM